MGEGRLPEVPNVQVTSVAEGSADELGADQNKQGIGPSEPTGRSRLAGPSAELWRDRQNCFRDDCLKS